MRTRPLRLACFVAALVALSISQVATQTRADIHRGRVEILSTATNATTCASNALCVGGGSGGAYVGSLVTRTVRVQYVEVTSTYAILTTDTIVNATSGTFTETLPSAGTVASGTLFLLKNTGAGTITVATTSSQTIDGASSLTIFQNFSYTLASTGANWIIV